jgi:methylthioribose-1-phosphate isomerase
VSAPTLVPVALAADGRAVRILDQRALPGAEVTRELPDVDALIDAIRTLAVRGAPALGIAGAAGVALVARAHAGLDAPIARLRIAADAARLADARPTAVNLRWGVERALARLDATVGPAEQLALAAADEAQRVLDEDLAMSRAIGAHGLALLPDPAVVLTHCNAGALATGGLGSALAPVYAAQAAGRGIRVVADETRPLLQGARLTAWELQRAGIDVTLITDGMAAAYLRAHRVDAVLVGADRIAANGDTANKIGTYQLALAARAHGVPFYVLAPWSTVDAATPDGDAIAIEERDADEVRMLGGVPTAPAGVRVWNPAFDVTPAALISGIITDRGVHRAPFAFGAP